MLLEINKRSRPKPTLSNMALDLVKIITMTAGLSYIVSLFTERIERT